MPTTGSGKYRYDNASDSADGPGQALRLAQDVSRNVDPVADATALAALVSGGYAFEGMRVWQADVKTEWLYTASAWVARNSDWITWSTAPTGITIGTGGSASSLQRYKWVSGRLYFDFKFVLGSSGFSVGTTPNITLPLNILTGPGGGSLGYGGGYIYDLSAVSTPAYTATVALSATSVRINQLATTGAMSNITASSPVIFAAGDIIAGGFWADPA